MAKPQPGEVRDTILAFLQGKRGDSSVAEIRAAVDARFGEPISASSVRSALNLGVGSRYERTGRGRYRLKK
jgi:hypothetical protein